MNRLVFIPVETFFRNFYFTAVQDFGVDFLIRKLIATADTIVIIIKI